MDNLGSTEMLQEKWAPCLTTATYLRSMTTYKKNVTAVVLENQERALREERGISEKPPTA